MRAQVANNTDTTLQSSISGGATSFTVFAGTGAEFPALAGAGDYCYVRLGSDATNEVVKCTARSGDVITCSATSSGWSAGTPVALTLCKQLFDEIPRIITANTSYTVQASGGDFATVDAALAALANVIIAPSAIVTLDIEDGVKTQSATLTDALISSHRIKLAGRNTYAATINSVQSSSGSAGSWSVILNMVSVANIAIGDFILVPLPTGGTLPSYLAGCHEVTNVDAVNTRITVASKHRNATPPSGAVAGPCTIIKTVLDWSAANITAFQSIAGRGFYGFANLVLKGGTSTGAGLLAQIGGKFLLDQAGADAKVGISGFSFGLQTAKGGTIDAPYAYVSGAATNAISSATGGVVIATSGVLTGCGSDGISSSYNGFINVDSAVITGAAGTNTALAAVGSLNSCVSITATSPSAVYNPAANTVGNENSYNNT
jgi:hypothetical protein